MTQLVLVVREPWHHKGLGRHVVRGELITDPTEVQMALSERPNSVTKRMSHPHEDAAIAAAKPVEVVAEQAPAPRFEPTAYVHSAE